MRARTQLTQSYFPETVKPHNPGRSATHVQKQTLSASVHRTGANSSPWLVRSGELSLRRCGARELGKSVGQGGKSGISGPLVRVLVHLSGPPCPGSDASLSAARSAPSSLVTAAVAGAAVPGAGWRAGAGGMGERSPLPGAYVRLHPSGGAVRSGLAAPVRAPRRAAQRCGGAVGSLAMVRSVRTWCARRWIGARTGAVIGATCTRSSSLQVPRARCCSPTEDFRPVDVTRIPDSTPV